MAYPIVEIKKTDKIYPSLLLEIHKPPEILYCRGNIELLSSRCLAVVGTRRITEYGHQATEKIVTDLAKHFTIVSGLALGIDAVAQKTTLNVGGYTIAVLSGGVEDNNIGPRTNFLLAQEILKKDGLLISEFRSKNIIYPIDFPIRNRIVSGISKGVLIVEADLKSGSLVTASLAVHQNRDVFAIPGSIFSSRTVGPHFLIKKGAKMVTSAEDILNEYDMLSLDKPNTNLKLKLSEIEQKIMDIINESGSGADTDQIIQTSGQDVSSILVALTGLELKRIIRQIDNGKYIRL